jgi:hypothetical protein
VTPLDPRQIFDRMLSAPGGPKRREAFGRPAYPVPDPPSDTVPISEVPVGLIPADPDPASLELVGTVCGKPIFARTEVLRAADQIRHAHPERHNWPADALRATILALRIGMTPRPSYREIAEMLNMSERHVLRAMKLGKKETVVERELTRLDREGFPMAVENVLEGLEQRDKEYTLEFLKGRGALNPKPVPGTSGTQAPTQFHGLVVQFVHDGTSTPVRPGSITANPNLALNPSAVIDAEKVGA